MQMLIWDNHRLSADEKTLQDYLHLTNPFKIKPDFLLHLGCTAILSGPEWTLVHYSDTYHTSTLVQYTQAVPQPFSGPPTIFVELGLENHHTRLYLTRRIDWRRFHNHTTTP